MNDSERFRWFLLGWTLGSLLLTLAATAVHAEEHEPEVVEEVGEVVYVRPEYSREEIEALIVDAAERHGVSPERLLRVARCESRLDPYAVGRAGERGVFQLHPYGLLRAFWMAGYTDEWDAEQQADYAASAFAAGLAGHWSCR